ncbi:hypothetical protein NEOLEDRAFT_1055472 [Neolentinus lepideus HHB14362 ss-1]|uniref:DUF4218 domain-containing protein n=1 Tax=Neolentinus lepideus HHB14362 ss-1 TaxID=1314782 RepID=A0A165VKS8_9AGAM|nr:hypothetical protein NEOLEDRAFT_1055472 [Neolentinus lepideus HHB14362 ss-1]
MHPCPWCQVTSVDINKPTGYDRDNFVAKNNFELLRQSFLSKDAQPRRQEQILNDYGIRWCIKNLLPGWLPSQKCALDFMHNVFLGIIAHLFTQVLFAGYMFTGAGGTDSSKQRFEDLVNSVQWPSHVTRLPKNARKLCRNLASSLGENQSLKKADEWRRLLHITPVLLWWSWKDSSDKIPDTEPPLPSNIRRKPTHSRNRRSLYSAVLKLCAAVRIFASRTISMSQARLAQDFLVQYCRHQLQLGVPLMINHHLSMHLLEMVKLFGPVYGWWLFAFERLNGMFEKVNHNGHDGGRLELTLMRNWVQTQLLYELLISLPNSAHELERRLLDHYILAEARSCGSMMTQIAIARSESTVQNIQLPRKPLQKTKFLDLRSCDSSCNLYGLLLEYCRHIWSDITLVDDMSLAPGITFFASQVAKSLPFVRKDNKFAFITSSDGTSRIPVQIAWLLAVQVTGKPPHICAVVQQLLSDDKIPSFPWDLYASTLGIHVSYADKFAEYEVIPVDRIDTPVALIPIFSKQIQSPLWVSISFDHVRISILMLSYFCYS